MSKYRAIRWGAIAAMSVICSVATGRAGTTSEVLLQARAFKYQFRAGQYDVAHKTVDMLEAAVKADPSNVELLNELGTAQFMRMTVVGHPGGDVRDIVPAANRAREVFEKAVTIDPNDPYALAGRGMARIIYANRTRESQVVLDGIADLNRAVELAPSKVPVRLMRAFTSVSLAPAVRNVTAVESDLRFLMNVAMGTRAADVLRVLLADVYMDAGRRADARREYRTAADSKSFGSELARSRLAALEKGDVSASDIADLRANLGRQCTMCHGK